MRPLGESTRSRTCVREPFPNHLLAPETEEDLQECDDEAECEEEWGSTNDLAEPRPPLHHELPPDRWRSRDRLFGLASGGPGATPGPTGYDPSTKPRTRAATAE